MTWKPIIQGKPLPDEVKFGMIATETKVCLVRRPVNGWQPIRGWFWWIEIPAIPTTPIIVLPHGRVTSP